jgi:hypothetical protein
MEIMPIYMTTKILWIKVCPRIRGLDLYIMMDRELYTDFLELVQWGLL